MTATPATWTESGSTHRSHGRAGSRIKPGRPAERHEGDGPCREPDAITGHLPARQSSICSGPSSRTSRSRRGTRKSTTKSRGSDPLEIRRRPRQLGGADAQGHGVRRRAAVCADGAHHVPNTLRWACEGLHVRGPALERLRAGIPARGGAGPFPRAGGEMESQQGCGSTRRNSRVPSDEAAMPHWPPAMRRWIRENCDMSLVQAAPLAEYKNAGMAASGATREDSE